MIPWHGDHGGFLSALENRDCPPEHPHWAGQPLLGPRRRRSWPRPQWPASRFRMRRSVSYRSGDMSSLNPFHHKAIGRQALLSMPKCAAHSAGSMTGTAESLGHPNACLRVERDQDRLCQRDLPAQRRVHRVLKKLIVEQTVAADRMKVSLPVNQDAAMPRGHVTVNLLERARATHRHAVQVPRRHVFPIGFFPHAGLLEELA